MLFGQEHVRRYRETDGAEGHEWNGVLCLVLTTRGRRSGEPRDAALIYGKEGEDHLVVASKGGADEPPAWYVNLRADPDVEVQVGAERFRARARTATAQERPHLWATMAGIWPQYEDYQRRTDREIAVVVLERA